jgi:hypothetical protein
MAELFSKEELEAILQSREGEPIKVVKVANQASVVENGENYASSTKRFSVEYLRNGVRKDAHLFAKLPSAIETHKAFVAKYKVFEREAVVYNKLLPDMCSNAEKRGVPRSLMPPHAQVFFAQGSERRSSRGRSEKAD